MAPELPDPDRREYHLLLSRRRMAMIPLDGLAELLGLPGEVVSIDTDQITGTAVVVLVSEAFEPLPPRAQAVILDERYPFAGDVSRETCRICGGSDGKHDGAARSDGKHDGAAHDARAADMPIR